MKRFLILFVTFVTVFAAAFASVVPAAASGGSGKKDGQTVKQDNKSDPLTAKQLGLKEKAIDEKMNGKAYGKTHEVARGQYVQLELEGEDMVWTVLGEFSDLKHNQIPQPDRQYDNSTLWESDFSSAYFNELLYGSDPAANSMHNYYLEQSSGRYTVAGEATEWIPVPGAAADYNDSPDANVWNFLKDSVNGWYQSQLDAGKTPDEINAYLASFDVQDRYDYDGDGDFNEPDGYIDHFQSIHAGEGEEAGAPEWTIWSHSWYAFSNLAGDAGPDFNKLGGIQIGDSNYWVGKYTIQPENGGVGVFVHEYAHDLGIPDLYDTNGGENSTGFWTLMSSGSWLSDATQDIGSKPGHLGVWEKLQLGWLNYEVASAGKRADFKLGPAETNTKQAQALFVVLPKKTVVTDIGAPYAGAKFYYSGSGDDLDQFMYKTVTLGSSPSLMAKVRYDIELDYDYAYVVVSTDGGASWEPVQTNLSTTDDPNGQNLGFGITSSSDGNWVDLGAELGAYAGQTVQLGFRYWTDAAAGGDGFMVDDIVIDGAAADGAEADAGWTFDGFRTTTGVESKLYSNYYVAEYRQYDGYDADLRNAYNFGWVNSDTYYNKVEFFPYQDGLLVSYWDTSMGDNNTSEHEGQGLLLPVDAHPNLFYRPDNGAVMRNRILSFDSTFTLTPTDGFTLHFNGQSAKIPSQKAVKAFDDTKSYYNTNAPSMSVITPNTGTVIEIKSISAQGNFMQVQVRPAK